MSDELMNALRRFLVAPAAIGLLSTSASTAAELNLNGMAHYSGKISADQINSVRQFSDIHPTDWAYQALSNLVERYGCVAGYPNGTFKGGQALTRFEAAALLNACLDRVTEVTDELKKLLEEFDKELALLRGRVDRLEAKVGELEATQFSTTTRLKADTRWVIGGLSYSGNQKNGADNTYKPPTGGKGTVASPYTYTQLRDALTFNYDVRINFDTSFTGKDLLQVQLRAGNIGYSGFGGPPTKLTQLEAGFQENLGNADGRDVVAVNRLYYRFPIRSHFIAIIGPLFASEAGLPFGYPSVYKSDQILRLFQQAGAPGTYNRLNGTGAGLFWKSGKTGFGFGGTYVSGNADAGQPNGTGGNSYTFGSNGGIGNEASQQTGILQLGYSGKNWNLSGAYAYNSGGLPILGTPLSQALLPNIYNSSTGDGHVSSWSIAGYWQPLQSGWLPSISAGWGYNTYSYNNKFAVAPTTSFGLDSATSQSWYVGLNWKDALIKGNALGMAIGQPTFITALSGPGIDGNVQDGQYAFEVFYKFQVSDHIAVTPALFWLTRPLGQLTGTSNVRSALEDAGVSNGSTLATFGGLIQTTFKF
ncbi:MAG: iron uptake porin [Comamonadaceae bacterium]